MLAECVFVCVCVIVVCECVCVIVGCVCVCVCEMEVGVEQEGLEECQDHSLSFWQKEQSGTRRQGFLCVSLVPQRLRKNWPTADS